MIIKEDRKNIKKILKIIWISFYSLGLIWIESEKLDCLEIYKKYLGTDYKPPKKYSTIISNHTGWIVNYINNLGYTLFSCLKSTKFRIKGFSKRSNTNRIYSKGNRINLFR